MPPDDAAAKQQRAYQEAAGGSTIPGVFHPTRAWMVPEPPAPSVRVQERHAPWRDFDSLDPGAVIERLTPMDFEDLQYVIPALLNYERGHQGRPEIIDWCEERLDEHPRWRRFL